MRTQIINSNSISETKVYFSSVMVSNRRHGGKGRKDSDEEKNEDKHIDMHRKAEGERER